MRTIIVVAAMLLLTVYNPYLSVADPHERDYGPLPHHSGFVIYIGWVRGCGCSAGEDDSGN